MLGFLTLAHLSVFGDCFTSSQAASKQENVRTVTCGTGDSKGAGVQAFSSGTLTLMRLSGVPWKLHEALRLQSSHARWGAALPAPKLLGDACESHLQAETSQGEPSPAGLCPLCPLCPPCPLGHGLRELPCSREGWIFSKTIYLSVNPLPKAPKANRDC